MPKPPEEFFSKGPGKGLRAACKACEYEAKKARLADPAKREAELARQREWYAANREAHIQKMREARKQKSTGRPVGRPRKTQ